MVNPPKQENGGSFAKSVMLVLSVVISTMIGAGTLFQAWVLPTTRDTMRDLIEDRIDHHRKETVHPASMTRDEFRLFIDRFHDFETKLDIRLDKIEKKVGL